MISKALGNILFIGRCQTTCLKQYGADTRLVPAQNILISHICRNPGCTQEDIIRTYGMHKSRVTHLLSALEDMGYIRREISEKDARCRNLYPLEPAQKLYPAIHEQYENFTEGILSGFSEEEIQLLTSLTARMRENAEKLLEFQNDRRQQ